MNTEKLVVKLKNVQKNNSMRKMWIEITKLMKYSYMGAMDLSGIYIDVDQAKPNQLPDWYLYFYQVSSIEKLKRLCSEEGGKKVLYLCNNKIEVVFPGANKWTLSMMMNVRMMLSNRELKIKTKRFESIADILKVLGRRLTEPYDGEYAIESCVQAKELTYVKFKNSAYATRAFEELLRAKYYPRYSKTYLCLCLESNEEEKMQTDQVPEKIPLPPINREMMSLNISKQHVKSNEHNNVIHIGSMRMIDFVKRFKIHDRIHFSLTSTATTQSIENPEDHDVLLLNEDVDLPDV